MSITFKDIITACGPVAGAASIGALVGPCVARYCLPYLGSESNFYDESGAFKTQEHTLSIPKITMISDLQKKIPRLFSLIVRLLPIANRLPIERPENQSTENVSKDRLEENKINIATIDILGVAIGSISQVAFLGLNQMTKYTPAGVTLTFSAFLGGYYMVKKCVYQQVLKANREEEISDQLKVENTKKTSEEAANDVLLIAIVTTIATATLLHLSSLVPRDMHLRTFGLIH